MNMYTQPVSELQDLVEKPAEHEWLELKSWVELTDNLTRANTARHLAAIANYGGGYLVFGFKKDGTRCDRGDDVRSAYSQDVLAGIIDRYLHPKFQCAVSFPEFAGVEHVVVWVPSHGASPVIAKANGPQDAKGVVQGIRSGTVYVRIPKPESVPATMPEHWDKVIQRCALARRDELLTMFSGIISGGVPKEPAPDRTRKGLEVWHTAAQRAAFVAASVAEAKFRYPLVENFMQFSYLIRHKNGESVGAKEAFPLIEKLNTAVRDTVRYGRSMFHPFTRPELSPRFNMDSAIDGGDTDFLEASTFQAGSNRGDFWRLALDGRASILRPLDEDADERAPPDIPLNSKWFDPRVHIRDIMEIVRHARAFSEEFSNVTDICFQFEWMGLKGRLATTHERYQSEAYTAQTDWRKVYDCIPLAALIGDVPAAVSKLFAPVYRMFNPRGEISADYVRHYMDSFIVPGT